MASVKNLKKEINYVLGDIVNIVYVWEMTNGGKPTETSDQLVDTIYETFDSLMTRANQKDVENRKAHFKTVICLNLNGEQQLFTGIINGQITTAKKGINGFGYDPIFVADGYQQTFAELTLEEKARISHRGIAVQKLINYLHLHAFLCVLIGFWNA